MSILEFSNLKYTYNGGKAFCGESAENWNKENYMQFSVHLVVERLPYFLCWVVWTVLKMDKSCLMERIFQKRVLVITAANIFPLFFNPII